MKKLVTLSSFLFPLALLAQYTSSQIKKFRILKITILSVTSGTEGSQKNETWYDEQGNDTAVYAGGQLTRRTSYDYNSKGQATRRIRYKTDGREAETAVYTYKADGTCTISNTDKDFGMTDLTYCDKSGKITRTVSPDQSERIYIYDARGRLTRVRSRSAEIGGVNVDIQYSYNPAGLLIKEVSKGDFKWTTSYSYNSKGLLVKSRHSSVTDGVPDPEVTASYEYVFHK